MIRVPFRACSGVSSRARPLCAALGAATLLAACTAVEVPKVPGITPYRMTVQQGNYLSQEMVAQLKPGMTKEQVRFVLGTPLVSDIFHADRWDYVYFLEHPTGKREQRNVSVIFEGGKLLRVIGDLLPSEADLKAAQKPAADPAKEAQRKAAEEKKAADDRKAAEAKKAAEDRKAADERRAAEQKKLADEKKAAEERKTAEDRRIADEKKAAEDRKAADQRKAAEERKVAARKSADDKGEPGFFERLRDKIMPAKADTKPAAEPAPAPKPAAAPAVEQPKAEVKPAPAPAPAPAVVVDPTWPAPPKEESKPAPEKEPGFFDRLREKLRL